MGVVGIILGLVFGVFVGVIIGILGVKLSMKIADKLILKNAMNVLKGKRKNQYEFEGKTIEVNEFAVEEEGINKIISLNKNHKERFEKTRKVERRPKEENGEPREGSENNEGSETNSIKTTKSERTPNHNLFKKRGRT